MSCIKVEKDVGKAISLLINFSHMQVCNERCRHSDPETSDYAKRTYIYSSESTFMLILIGIVVLLKSSKCK